MGLLNEARREFIAAPDSAKGQIVYKWPDQNIRKFSRAIVEPDALAVFMNQGQVMGVLNPGQHTLDANQLVAGDGPPDAHLRHGGRIAPPE